MGCVWNTSGGDFLIVWTLLGAYRNTDRARKLPDAVILMIDQRKVKLEIENRKKGP